MELRQQKHQPREKDRRVEHSHEETGDLRRRELGQGERAALGAVERHWEAHSAKEPWLRVDIRPPCVATSNCRARCWTWPGRMTGRGGARRGMRATWESAGKAGAVAQQAAGASHGRVAVVAQDGRAMAARGQGWWRVVPAAVVACGGRAMAAWG